MRFTEKHFYSDISLSLGLHQTVRHEKLFVNAILKSGYETNKTKLQWLHNRKVKVLIAHQTPSLAVQEFTSICAPKLETWALQTDIYIWLISFQNGAQGSYTWWWCTNKKLTIKTETPFCICVAVVTIY